MGITGVTAYVIKMPSSPTTIFVSFNVRLWILSHCLKLSVEPRYCCLQLLNSTKYIALQELQCNSLLTKYFLPVTVKVNMFSKTIKMLQISQLLQLMMLLLLVLFLLGKSHGDSNSLKFLLRLYMVLKAIAGNSSLMFSLLCKSGISLQEYPY